MNTSLKLKFFEIVARVQHLKAMKKTLKNRNEDATARTVGPWFTSAVVVVVVDMVINVRTVLRMYKPVVEGAARQDIVTEYIFSGGLSAFYTSILRARNRSFMRFELSTCFLEGNRYIRAPTPLMRETFAERRDRAIERGMIAP